VILAGRNWRRLPDHQETDQVGGTSSRRAWTRGPQSTDTTRSGAEEGRKLLQEAVAAFRSALEVFTKADLPQSWALTQNNLGGASLISCGDPNNRLTWGL